MCRVAAVEIRRNVQPPRGAALQPLVMEASNVDQQGGGSTRYVACLDLGEERSYNGATLVSEVLADLLGSLTPDTTSGAWGLELEGWPGLVLPAHLQLRRVSVLKVCCNTFGSPPRLRAVRLNGRAESWQSSVVGGMAIYEHELSLLVPPRTGSAVVLSDPEVAAFRFKRAAERRADTLCASPYWLFRYTDFEPLPLASMTHVMISVQVSKTLCPVFHVKAGATTPVDLFHLVCGRWTSMPSAEASADDHVFKVCGARDYLYGAEALASYDCVRCALSSGRRLDLALLRKADLQPPASLTTRAISVVDKLWPSPASLSEAGANRSCALRLTFLHHVSRGVRRDDDSKLLPVRVTLSYGMETLKEQELLPGVSIDFGVVSPGMRFRLVVCENRLEGERPRYLGWANVALYDECGAAIIGPRQVWLWAPPWPEFEPTVAAPCVSNTCQERSIGVEIDVQCDASPQQVDTTAAPPPLSGADPAAALALAESFFSTCQMHISSDESAVIWAHRRALASDSRFLPLIALSAPVFLQPSSRDELIALLSSCPPSALPLSVALQFIGPQFSDPAVRECGVRALDHLSDGQLVGLIPQLLHALLLELHHESLLARTLLRRALAAPLCVGHALFWHLRSVLHVQMSSRYSLLLEAYCRALCPGSSFQQQIPPDAPSLWLDQLTCLLSQGLWNELLAQVQVVNLFSAAAAHIRTVGKHEARQSALRGYLAQLRFPDVFALPTDARRLFSGVTVAECDVVPSKRLPLLLKLQDAEAGQPPVTILFKAQSMFANGFAVGLLRVLDHVWRARDLDLRLSRYRVQPLAEELGIIELLPNVMSTHEVTKKKRRPAALFSQTAMREHFKEEGWWQRERCRQAAVAVLGLHRYQRTRTVLGNGRDVFQLLARSILDTWKQPEWVWQDDFQAVQGEFSSSCAAYAIASHVLGVMDRHNDNILTSPTGRLAFVEMDHVLGMSRRRWAIKRERPAFTFDVLWRFVIEWDRLEDSLDKKNEKINLQDSSWSHFLKLLTDSYIALRAEAPLLCSLVRVSFVEHATVADLEWCREALRLDLETEPEVAQHVLQLTEVAVKWRPSGIGSMIHILAH
jgi:hypothetical protein